MLVCLTFIVISTILSLGFKDIYEIEKTKVTKNNTIKSYCGDLEEAFKFILKSRRMKAFILFQIVFFSLIKVVEIYRGDLLLDLGVPEEEYSIFFAVLTLIGGISLSLKESIEKNFKNRTLAFISLIYIGSCIFIGIISSLWSDTSILGIILVMLAIQKVSTSTWYILEAKYLRNFTNEKSRNKIAFTYEFIGGIAVSIISMLGG